MVADIYWPIAHVYNMSGQGMNTNDEFGGLIYL